MSLDSNAVMPRSTLAAIAAILLLAGVCSGQAPGSARALQLGVPTEHVDSLYHGHGFDGTGGIHFGVPAVASVALGAKYWLGDALAGAVFATVEPGVLALRYGAGYQLYEERALGLGVAVRFAQLRGWRDALGVARGVLYTGGDVTLSGPYTLSARVGAYERRTADGGRVSLKTFDIGLGF